MIDSAEQQLARADHHRDLVAVLIGVLLCARIFVLVFRIDRMTTVSWDTPVSLSIALLFGSTLGWLSLRAYLDRPLVAQGVRMGYFRRDRPGAWFLLGVISAIFVLILGTYLTGSLCGVVAQHVKGTSETLEVNTESVTQGHSARNPCEWRLSVRTTTGETFEFCTKLYATEGFAAGNVSEGARLELVLNSSVFGRAVSQVRSLE
jgi:hypothetical protein